MIDTAEKRCAALKFNQQWLFGTVPSGTVDRYSAARAYSGIAAGSGNATQEYGVRVRGPLASETVRGPVWSVRVRGPEYRVNIIGDRAQ